MRCIILVLFVGVVTLATCVLLVFGWLPLGVAGEWEWGRVPHATLWVEYLAAATAVVAYVAFVALGVRWASGGAWSHRAVVVALVVAGLVVQMAVQQVGFGLAKWPFVLFNASSSGYYTAAKSDVTNPREFIADYERIQSEYMRDKGPYHLATHPPGLVLLHHEVLAWCERHPAASRAWLELAPVRVRDGFDALAGNSAAVPLADQASLWLVGLLSQLACAVTVVPVYLLGRRAAGPRSAWLAAAFWPLVPATTIFMPKSDVLYPLLATTCLACSLTGRTRLTRIGGGLAAGLALWFGMYLSFGLATLAALVAVAVLPSEGVRTTESRRRSAERGGAFLAAFASATAAYVVATGHNLLATWWQCYSSHAKFYDRHPRSYGSWVVFDPAEFVVALGLPLAIAAVIGAAWLVRDGRRASAEGNEEKDVAKNGMDPNGGLHGGRAIVLAWLVVLLALDVSGKNLGEVARLWIFLMPFAVPAAAAAIERLSPRNWPALALLALQAVQTVVFAANVQGFIDPASVKL